MKRSQPLDGFQDQQFQVFHQMKNPSSTNQVITQSNQQFQKEEYLKYGIDYQLAFLSNQIIRLVASQFFLNLDQHSMSLKEVIIKKVQQFVNPSVQSKKIITKMLTDGIQLQSQIYGSQIIPNKSIQKFFPTRIITSQLACHLFFPIESENCIFYGIQGISKSFSVIFLQKLNNFRDNYVIQKNHELLQQLQIQKKPNYSLEKIKQNDLQPNLQEILKLSKIFYLIIEPKDAIWSIHKKIWQQLSPKQKQIMRMHKAFQFENIGRVYRSYDIRVVLVIDKINEYYSLIRKTPYQFAKFFSRNGSQKNLSYQIIQWYKDYFEMLIRFRQNEQVTYSKKQRLNNQNSRKEEQKLQILEDDQQESQRLRQQESQRLRYEQQRQFSQQRSQVNSANNQTKGDTNQEEELNSQNFKQKIFQIVKLQIFIFKLSKLTDNIHSLSSTNVEYYLSDEIQFTTNKNALSPRLQQIQYSSLLTYKSYQSEMLNYTIFQILQNNLISQQNLRILFQKRRKRNLAQIKSKLPPESVIKQLLLRKISQRLQVDIIRQINPLSSTQNRPKNSLISKRPENYAFEILFSQQSRRYTSFEIYKREFIGDNLFNDKVQKTKDPLFKMLKQQLLVIMKKQYDNNLILTPLMFQQYFGNKGKNGKDKLSSNRLRQQKGKDDFQVQEVSKPNESLNIEQQINIGVNQSENVRQEFEHQVGQSLYKKLKTIIEDIQNFASKQIKKRLFKFCESTVGDKRDVSWIRKLILFNIKEKLKANDLQQIKNLYNFQISLNEFKIKLANIKLSIYTILDNNIFSYEPKNQKIIVKFPPRLLFNLLTENQSQKQIDTMIMKQQLQIMFRYTDNFQNIVEKCFIDNLKTCHAFIFHQNPLSFCLTPLSGYFQTIPKFKKGSKILSRDFSLVKSVQKYVNKLREIIEENKDKQFNSMVLEPVYKNKEDRFEIDKQSKSIDVIIIKLIPNEKQMIKKQEQDEIVRKQGSTGGRERQFEQRQHLVQQIQTLIQQRQHLVEQRQDQYDYQLQINMFDVTISKQLNYLGGKFNKYMQNYKNLIDKDQKIIEIKNYRYKILYNYFIFNVDCQLQITPKESFKKEYNLIPISHHQNIWISQSNSTFNLIGNLKFSDSIFLKNHTPMETIFRQINKKMHSLPKRNMQIIMDQNLNTQIE